MFLRGTDVPTVTSLFSFGSFLKKGWISTALYTSKWSWEEMIIFQWKKFCRMNTSHLVPNSFEDSGVNSFSLLLDPWLLSFSFQFFFSILDLPAVKLGIASSLTSASKIETFQPTRCLFKSSVSLPHTWFYYPAACLWLSSFQFLPATLFLSSLVLVLLFALTLPS